LVHPKALGQRGNLISINMDLRELQVKLFERVLDFFEIQNLMPISTIAILSESQYPRVQKFRLP
jgi:hypothetical protein